jgi:hypothetical protein
MAKTLIWGVNLLVRNNLCLALALIERMWNEILWRTICSLKHFIIIGWWIESFIKDFPSAGVISHAFLKTFRRCIYLGLFLSFKYVSMFLRSFNHFLDYSVKDLIIVVEYRLLNVVFSVIQLFDSNFLQLLLIKLVLLSFWVLINCLVFQLSEAFIDHFEKLFSVLNPSSFS